jgi:translation initiation factor 3 subunit K
LPTANDALSETVQKLSILAELLDSAQFESFWDEFNNDDLYLDYTADVYGFEDSIRRGIARSVGSCMTKIRRDILEKWVNLNGESFESWVASQTGWNIVEDMIVIPSNSENVVASDGVKGENLKWEVIRDRLLKHPQF